MVFDLDDALRVLRAVEQGMKQAVPVCRSVLHPKSQRLKLANDAFLLGLVLLGGCRCRSQDNRNLCGCKSGRYLVRCLPNKVVDNRDPFKSIGGWNLV